MIFDFDIINTFYRELPSRISEIRKLIDRPLTLSEKILYCHLFNNIPERPFARGVDYVDFAPDRVAMQDATAQMALLQFMMAGKENTAVPASVHCDHLIMAKSGAAEDLKTAISTNKEVYDFLAQSAINIISVSGIPEQVLFIR